MKKIIRISLVIGALALLLTNVGMNVDINLENGSIEFVSQSAEACQEHGWIVDYLIYDGCSVYEIITGNYYLEFLIYFCWTDCYINQGEMCCVVTDETYIGY